MNDSQDMLIHEARLAADRIDRWEAAANNRRAGLARCVRRGGFADSECRISIAAWSAECRKLTAA
jgi:hypothetical protein